MDLLNHNLSGALPVLKDYTGLRATPENFITLMDYAMHWQPELIPQLVFRNGKGNILGFVDFLTGGKENSYASDIVQHAEIGRTRTVLKNVSITGNEFTSAENHNLRPGDVIMISNGTDETQAKVTATPTDKVFEALNDRGVGFTGFTTVTVIVDFSSRFNKGTEGYDRGRKATPEIIQNFTHIVKGFYDVAESEMAQITWIQTPEGPKWFNLEMELNSINHDNKVELTAIFNYRADDTADSTLAGHDQGMKGAIQMIEERGNIANEYIETLEDLGEVAKRIKIEGPCREVTIWGDHQQMLHFNTIAAGVNGSFVGGASYGVFNNSKEMAIFLDFKTIFYAGVTFHFRSWDLLDDPTLMGATGFDTTSLGWIAIPTGMKDVTIDGNAAKIPYFNIRYRKAGIVDRRKKVKFRGILGVEQSLDRASVEYITEMTAQLAGANNFYVGRRSEFYV